MPTPPEITPERSDEEVGAEARATYNTAIVRLRTEGYSLENSISDLENREIYLQAADRVYHLIGNGAYGVIIEGYNLADTTETGVIGPVSLPHLLMLEEPLTDIGRYCMNLRDMSPTYGQLGQVGKDLKPEASQKISETDYRNLTSGRGPQA